jgi:hypothetical protein
MMAHPAMPTTANRQIRVVILPQRRQRQQYWQHQEDEQRDGAKAFHVANGTIIPALMCNGFHANAH